MSTTSGAESTNHNMNPPRASLQGIPRELRDRIYQHLADSEDRFVLGWRFVEARKDESLSFDTCFDTAIALHPLSMTCRQMLEEYRDAHFSAFEPEWIFVVNNFDLNQLDIFSEYVDKEDFFTTKEARTQRDPPAFSLRLQMDNRVVGSMRKFCEKIREVDSEAEMQYEIAMEEDEDNDEENDHESIDSYLAFLTPSDESVRRLGGAHILTQYRKRTTGSVNEDLQMSFENTEGVEALYQKLTEDISSDWCADLTATIEHFWVDPFSEAVKRTEWPEEMNDDNIDIGWEYADSPTYTEYFGCSPAEFLRGV